MIYNYDEVKRFAIETLKKVPVFRYSQLREMLSIEFDISIEESKNMIKRLQKDGYLLIEGAGHIVTKELYLQWSHDKFLDGIDKNSDVVRLDKEFEVYGEPIGSNGIAEYKVIGSSSVQKELAKKKERFDIMQEMWVVASYLPMSDNFIITSAPFNISFMIPIGETSEVHLYQVMNTTSKDIMAKCALLQTSFKMKPEHRSYMEHIYRIAIVEDERDAILIPRFGFGLIVTLKYDENRKLIHDPETGAFFTIVEKRNTFEERWGDCL